MKIKLPNHELDYQEKINGELQAFANAKKRQEVADLNEQIQRTKLGSDTGRQGGQNQVAQRPQ